MSFKNTDCRARTWGIVEPFYLTARRSLYHFWNVLYDIVASDSLVTGEGYEVPGFHSVTQARAIA